MIRLLAATAVLAGLLIAAGQVPAAPRPTEDKNEEAMKKLVGNWKLTRKEFKGNLWPGVDRIKEGILVDEGKIIWLRDGREAGQKGDLTIDASTNPMSIDVETTQGSFIGKKMLGIYELKGNKLTICWSEPGGEKRPKKFTTKPSVGSGAFLESYLQEGGDTKTDEKASAKDAKKDNKAGAKSDAKGDSTDPLKKLEGNWKLVRSERKGNLRPLPGIVKESIFIEDGKITWLRDGKEVMQKGDASADGSTNPKAIDVEITRGSFIGKKLLGIFEVKGDKLTICWSEEGGEKRPKKFVTKPSVGSGVTMETYQKEKD
jgi:uncharacterized protein (TIGR03067 family)